MSNSWRPPGHPQAPRQMAAELRIAIEAEGKLGLSLGRPLHDARPSALGMAVFGEMNKALEDEIFGKKKNTKQIKSSLEIEEVADVDPKQGCGLQYYTR